MVREEDGETAVGIPFDIDGDGAGEKGVCSEFIDSPEQATNRLNRIKQKELTIRSKNISTSAQVQERGQLHIWEQAI